MFGSVIQAIIMIVLPAVLMWSENRFKLCKTLGAVVLCYAVGIIMGNIPGLNLNMDVSKHLSEASVPLAIPVLLFATNFIAWFKSSKETMISFVISIISVLVCASVFAFVFKSNITDINKVAGMVIGVYTGGTPNMSAIGLALNVSQEVFIKMNGVDILVGMAYLMFLLALGGRFFGLFLKPYQKKNILPAAEAGIGLSDLSKRQRLKKFLIHFLLSILIVAISVGASILIFGKMNVAFIILGLTTLGIAASFNTKIRTMPGSYELGQYLLLIFAISVGSMANVNTLLSEFDSLLYYTALTLLTTVAMHSVLAYIFKIDRDTMIITSTASVFGPPFVGCVAEALGNREIVVAGLTTGLVGYAIGNFLGLGLASLLG